MHIWTRNYKVTTSSLATIFVPVLIILANHFFIRSPAVGILATAAFLLIGGYSIQNRWRFLASSSVIIKTSVGIFLLLTIIVVPGSFFVIFYNFNWDVFAWLLVSVALLVSYLKIRDSQTISIHRHLSAETVSAAFNRMVRQQRYSFIIVAVIATLLVTDTILLLERRDIPSSLVQGWTYPRPIFSLWQLVPVEHIYIFFAFAIVLMLSIGRLNHGMLIVLILLFSVNMELVAAYVVPTVYVESDPWYMMGEVNQNIENSKRVTLLDVFTGNSHDTSTIKVGPLTVPTILVTGWARGIPNAVAIFFIQSTSLTTVQIWPFLAPVMVGFFLRVLLYAVCESLTQNRTVAIVSLLAPAMSSVLFVTGLISIKSTLALPFVMLGILVNIWYIRSVGRRAAMVNIVFTLLNIFNYSLYFVFFIQTLLGSMILKAKRAITGLDKMVYFPTTTAVLAFLLSIFDRLLNSGNTNLQFAGVKNLLVAIASWLLQYMGLTIDEGGKVITISPRIAFMNDPLWILSNLIYLSFLIYGIISFKRMRSEYFNFIMWIFVISHLTTFIAIYLQSPPSSLGLRTPYIEALTEVPFIAIGIWRASQLFQQIKLRYIAYPICMGLISVPIVAAITTNPPYYWPSAGDLMTVEYLIKNDHTSFSVATLPVVSNVIYTYTNGRLIAGGFDTPHAYQSGNVYQDLVGNYMTLTREPTKIHLDKMLADTKSCNVYILISDNDPISKDKFAVQRLAVLMQDHVQFDYHGETTHLLRYSQC